MMNDEILKFIGEVVAYGGSATFIAYMVFKHLSNKWIENKFQEKLENYKTEQQKELEVYKHKINSLFNRVSKIHEKEFEVLPQMYSLMIEAIEKISIVTSTFKQYHNVKDMSKERLEVFLENSFLEDWQKEELKKSYDKQKYYQKASAFFDLHNSKKAIYEFHSYIERNRLFLKDDIKQKFNEIDSLIWEIYNSSDVAEEVEDNKMKVQAWRDTRDKIEPIRQEIERLVQERLNFDKVE